jgi:uncharacterized membrane protein YbhN (UPF0104 family)
MQMSTFKKVGKRVLQVGLPLAILVFFALYVRNQWSLLTAHTFHWNPWLLLLAFVGFLLQELSYGLIWRAVLARLGVKLDLRACLRIYLASEFVRYLPGNVWHVLTRILWIGKYGVSRPVAFASMTVELITKLAAGALIFALSLLFWSDVGTVRTFLHGAPVVAGIGVFTILALLIILHPRVLNGLLNAALRLLKREPVSLSLRYNDILLVTLAWSISWIVAGCAFYVLALALWPGLPLSALPICVGIYAIGWDIGFLAFLTPSGLGFREGAITALLALALPQISPVIGAIIALLSRFVSTVAELVCVSIAYASGGYQARAVQQEQKRLPLLAKSDTREQEKDMSLSDAEPSLSVGVEGGTGSE